MKKKILVNITTGLTPTGGLTTVMMNYYRVLDKSRVEIDFCSTNDVPSILLQELRDNGSQYFKLPPRSHIIAYMAALTKRSKGYDIVHIHANSATAVLELLSAKWSKVPCRIVHNHSSRCQCKLMSNSVMWLYRKLYTCAVACSEEAGNWLYGKGKFTILRNAIYVDRFVFNPDKRVEVRRTWGISDDEVLIGHVGKFMDAKNHPFLLELFAKYHERTPKARLMLVGDGELRDEVERAIRENNVSDSVILAGLRQDIPDLLQAFDLFVFPSIYEGMPLSVVEAQASGLPCVVSDAVTPLINIGRDVVQLPLAKGTDYWCDYLCNTHYGLSRRSRCEQNYELITKAGYNIKTEANNLLRLYGVECER